MKVDIVRFADIPEDLRDEQPDNGCGKELANYLSIDWQDGSPVMYLSDAMEPEDKSFTRDLSWIKNVIELAHSKGVEFGRAAAGMRSLITE